MHKKIIITLALVAILSSLCAQDKKLNLYVESIRFPVNATTTSFHINYKIPYPSLTFVEGEYGYEATVEVSIDVLRSDGYRNIKTFTNKILTADPTAPSFSLRSYLDKISLDLTSNLNLRLRFTDLASGATASWEEPLEMLDPQSLLSDLELSSDVRRDTTRYLEKFHRGEVVYEVRPDHTFNPMKADSVWIYAKYLTPYDMEQTTASTAVTLSSNVKEISFVGPEVTLKGGMNEIIFPVRLIDLAPGTYSLRFDLLIPGQKPISRDSYLIRPEQRVGVWRMFNNIDDEKLLLSYFVRTSDIRSWDNLSDNGKKNFLDMFWTGNDPSPGTPENEFFELVQKRVSFANENYSVYNEGWRTDRGRIYIRNGAPDEVEKDHTGGSAPASFTDTSTDQTSPTNPVMRTSDITQMMGDRDYQIWKYYIDGDKRIYLFFDKSTSGDLQLIYVDGDDREVGDPQWEYYMGDSFDESELEL